MNKLDDLAWKREFDRVEANQEKRKSKREGWDGKINSFWGTDLLQIEIDELNKRAEAANNEINR